MSPRHLPWFVLMLAAILAAPPAAFADAKSEVSLVTEKGHAIYTVDYFVASTGTRTILVTVKATWAENLKATEHVYEIEVRAGEKKLVVTEHPPQTNFKAVITAARYK